jgi:murein DD-endopeptidase MepM/ murein hydrolase activator NlpD
MHIMKQYRLHIYAIGIFVAGLIVGLSNMIFTDEPQTAPAVVQEVVTETIVDEVSDTPVETVISNVAADEPLGLTETMSLSAENNDETYAKEIRIKSGQGLMDALLNNGAERGDAFNAINSLGDLYNVRKIQVGQLLNAAYSPSGDLVRLSLQKDFDHRINVEREGDIYKSTVEELATQTITRHASGIIEDSLFLAAQRQGLPQITIVELIRIFSYDVDFQREMRKGDQFEIFYERTLSEDGRRVREGNILFAKLILSGKEINLYRHTPDNSDYAEYFHEDGQSSKKALMKTPIEGARLSSNYGRRKHPVLGYTRMHKGVDFSAPTGTPIMAAGDGVVERSSWFGSFGNYVRLRHNGSYKTIYAHMSKYGRGIKKGARVRQGQIIGYVGATGRVTGRHLHYEVYKDGTQVNPMNLKMPSGIKLAGAPFESFKVAMTTTNTQIDETKSHILLTKAITEQAPSISAE